VVETHNNTAAPPIASLFTVVPASNETGTGSGALLFVPLPMLPCSFQPHKYNCPSSSTESSENRTIWKDTRHTRMICNCDLLPAPPDSDPAPISVATWDKVICPATAESVSPVRPVNIQRYHQDTGGLGDFIPVSPSCPRSDRPQEYTVPSRNRTMQ
jgi:hypothetical protein